MKDHGYIFTFYLNLTYGVFIYGDGAKFFSCVGTVAEAICLEFCSYLRKLLNFLCVCASACRPIITFVPGDRFLLLAIFITHTLLITVNGRLQKT
jgi:hypothetical protein